MYFVGRAPNQDFAQALARATQAASAHFGPPRAEWHFSRAWGHRGGFADAGEIFVEIVAWRGELARPTGARTRSAAAKRPARARR
jgi:hypothetical protein